MKNKKFLLIPTFLLGINCIGCEKEAPAKPDEPVVNPSVDEIEYDYDIPTSYNPLKEYEESEGVKVNNAEKLYSSKEVLTNPSRTDDTKKLITAINTFGTEIFQKINSKLSSKANSAFSPASVFFALSLISKVASGECKAKLLENMGVTEELLEQQFPIVYSLCNNCSYSGKERVDNSIWLDDGYTFNHSTLEDLANIYFANSFTGSFANENKKMNDSMSAYVRECTEGLINPHYNFDESTSFAILSSLFFEDAWLFGMRPLELYKNDYFELPNGQKKLVNYYGANKLNDYSKGTMIETDKYRAMYVKTSGTFKVTFIVPKNGYTPDNLFNKETFEEVKDLGAGRNDNSVTQVVFPEFSASFDGDIAGDLLSSFGMKSTFDFGDFAKSKKDNSSFKQNIKLQHTTKLEATKDYIKGGAAISAGASGMLTPKFAGTFMVDRPFVYTIKDLNGVELFNGIIYEP